jgi:2-(1,2-epoxy-1,2-dihydrophenyl)acetyl-CoA isomerase
MTFRKILVGIRDGIMTVTLNRPEKLNAIDNALARELLDALAEAARDEQVRVLLLRGAGRAFCAGRDVSAPPTDQDLELVQAVAVALVGVPKPVVAAVHGWTLGAGLEWMLDADLVVAAQSSRFKLPEAALGVFVTGGLTATLPAYAGLARAKGVILLGEEFGAAQAHAWGLVWEVVADVDLEATATSLSARLAKLQPDLVVRYKKVLNDIGLQNFQRAVEAESQAQKALRGQASG